MPSIWSLALSVLPLLALIPGTESHGHVRKHTLNGVEYIGYLPYNSPDYTLDAPSIVRKIFGEGPIKTPLERNITCNQNAVPILNRTAPITAGTQVKFQWNEWPHNGPIFTYMAKCKNNDCGQFWGDDRDGVGAWFKIDHSGYDNTTSTWATTKMFQQGNAWYSTVPACLEPGNYLIRHEIISVSEGYKLGGAQFYPNCAQVTVLASGKPTVKPTGYSIPGIYKATDPGILFNTNTQYTYYPLPGPPVFTCP